MEENFTHVLQHMDVSARISKWIVQLHEFNYTVMVEESTRAALAGILTHQFKEKTQKKEMKNLPPPLPPPVKEIEQAYALYFDGAYRRKEGKAAGIVVFNPAKEKLMEREMVLLNGSSNNKTEYAVMMRGFQAPSNCINQILYCLIKLLITF